MAFPDEPQGAETPVSETAPHPVERPHYLSADPFPDEAQGNDHEDGHYGEPHTYEGDWSASGQPGNATVLTEPYAEPKPIGATAGGAGAPPKPPDPPDDDEEDGMSRMSFIEHLEELRKRLIYALGGVGIAFLLCLFFSDQLWEIVRAPAESALRALKVNPPTLKLISPMDAFQIMWFKVPVLFAIFLACPWVLYQVWAFISPGLYKKEKRYAVPFVVSSAGLFVLGGLFAYFIAFRYGLEFLLGIGMGKGIDPTVNVNDYYDIFVDIMLGVGIVFEIPVLLFLLTLLHVASPAFLVRHSRYAILAIVILAAIITPTGDVFNLTLFATPMIILFYIGILASYILVLRREKRRFPWGIVLKWGSVILLALVVIGFFAARYYGYHFVPRWPLFVK